MNADSASPRLDDDHVHLIVEVFRMLADPTRVQLLWALTGQELSVNELAERVGKPAPSVSQHLAKLRMARLVCTRRSGTTMYYSLENQHVRQLVTDAVFNAEHAGHGIPPHHRADAVVHPLAGGSAKKAHK
ncbi:ArsR family transcriptional regulator [Mycobacterium nebraskense]|uniref:ArsR family transcriptional regulator n=1 Tax=Mycobacterium nebraskense TaxID=244292 RepID=A0A1X1YY90_9MYCO|nr:metalloregulator ArsR/SmtB family transcription factor [Mycobacterium nebraskense]MCV7116287.1 winged helix-turn-helix transcriptional regulator [Mycobacterium nebraskense]ORW16046.1 ArsR family transcriptional regulator [Mycobacterium nebraskense]